MTDLDFPTWFGIGSYGGLAAAILSAIALVAYAQWSRHGSPRTLARAILVCLFASSLMLAAIWWNQNRLDLYGPSLPGNEVTFWLAWAALLGWALPFGTLAGYVALALPQPVAASTTLRSLEAISLNAPERRIEPLGAGRAWGRLIPLDGPFASQPLSLTRKLTLAGREIDNDLVLDDELSSRRHAEIIWDNGRVQVRDLDSLNGTFVNGQSARGQLAVRSGDILQFGARSYRIELLTSGGLRMPADTLAAGETDKVPGVSAIRPVATPLVLVGISPPVEGYRWQLEHSLTSIGRDATSNVVLQDESVSRVHAQIVRQQTGLYLTDLNSSNGTCLNGLPVDAPALLANGDLITFGEVALRCELPLTMAQATVPLSDELRAAARSNAWSESSAFDTTPPSNVLASDPREVRSQDGGPTAPATVDTNSQSS